MLNDLEREELKRIIDKFIREGRCSRPVHPDKIIEEVRALQPAEREAEPSELSE